MINPHQYFETLQSRLLETFGENLLYLGMQGSYLRGEADEMSDIDAMVILSAVSREELEAYRRVIDGMDFPVTPCGFLCGKEEMRAWNPMELCQLRQTTKDIYGCLDDFIGPFDRRNEIDYVRMSLSNLYHAICHGYIYHPWERCAQKLPGLYKQVFYILQEMHYLRTGAFLPTRRELMEALNEEERGLFEMAGCMRAGKEFDAKAAWDALYGWCSKSLAELADMK